MREAAKSVAVTEKQTNAVSVAVAAHPDARAVLQRNVKAHVWRRQFQKHR
jgi:hypothetical protein